MDKVPDALLTELVSTLNKAALEAKEAQENFDPEKLRKTLEDVQTIITQVLAATQEEGEDAGNVPFAGWSST